MLNSRTATLFAYKIFLFEITKNFKHKSNLYSQRILINLFFSHRTKNFMWLARLHAKMRFALIILRLYFAFFVLNARWIVLYVHFALMQNEPKNQERNMLQRSLYKCK